MRYSRPRTYVTDVSASWEIDAEMASVPAAADPSLLLISDVLLAALRIKTGCIPPVPDVGRAPPPHLDPWAGIRQS
jgi:hypothetical protein